MKRHTILIILGFLFFVSGEVARSHESIVSSDFHLVEKKATELATRHGTGQVLLVYDIDNTLLTPNQLFGSDPWFNWQAAKIQSGDFVDAVANSFNGLLEVQGMIFSLGKMHVVDPDAPAIFNGLEGKGYSSLILTSRGPSNRDATKRELDRAGYDLNTKMLQEQGIAGSFIPYDIDNPEDSGLTRAEVNSMGLGAARQVSLQDGIFLTSGQHKGAMLRTLLFKLKRTFRAILFIDDTPKNVIRVHEAFDSKGVEVVTIRYSSLDEAVKKFESGDKSEVTSAWLILSSAISRIFK